MTETESMVVRVAKAVGTVLYGYVNPVDTPNTWATSLEAARAAIEAMKDCDNDMLEAMWCAMFQDKFTGHELPMLNAGWVAALVKALEE